MNWQKAKELADRICSELYPWTDQLFIAGSVRRGCQHCGDIEIVCIPKRHSTSREEKTLFDDLPVLIPGKVVAVQKFVDIVNKYRKVKGDPLTGRYTRRVLQNGYNLDISMADTDNIGLILAIRTGSESFIKYLMWEIKHKGYKSEEGYLYNAEGDRIPVPSEEVLFELLKIPYIPTDKRHTWPRNTLRQTQ